MVEKAWAALLAARQSNGLPGYSQPQGAAPGIARKDDSQVYTTGAYLLAASELQSLAPLMIPQNVTLTPPVLPATRAALQPDGTNRKLRTETILPK